MITQLKRTPHSKEFIYCRPVCRSLH